MLPESYVRLVRCPAFPELEGRVGRISSYNEDGVNLTAEIHPPGWWDRVIEIPQWTDAQWAASQALFSPHVLERATQAEWEYQQCLDRLT